MVTFLRPHRHAHGPAAVDVRLHRSQQLSSSSSLPSRCSTQRPMAQDPSHPHRQSKDTSPPQQQPEQQELTEQPPAPAPAPPPPQQQPEQQEVTQQPLAPAPAPPPPPRDVQETSTSSSSDTSSWLQLGIGPSPSSPSSSRGKRPRTEYEAGPSTSVQPGTSPTPPPQLRLSLFPGPSSPSSSAAAVGTVVAAAPPPPAHEAGTWFVLRAAQNQREPPLPQIPRSYLRVRDGRMTVRLVMRYLVNKLGLEDDSELEITCRGQHLLPAMTLQHVRDNIWRPPPAEAAAVLPAPGSPSTNQIMTLHYGRS